MEEADQRSDGARAPNAVVRHEEGGDEGFVEEEEGRMFLACVQATPVMQSAVCCHPGRWVQSGWGGRSWRVWKRWPGCYWGFPARVGRRRSRILICETEPLLRDWARAVRWAGP